MRWTHPGGRGPGGLLDTGGPTGAVGRSKDGGRSKSGGRSGVAGPPKAAQPPEDSRLRASGDLLEVRGLHHSYRRRRVLRGIDFALRPGVLAGIVGENGAGKSTLLKALSGELRPDRGVVRHRGRFGYCPQTVVLDDAFTVRQHLDFFRSAFRLPDLRRAHEVLETLAFTEYLDERAGRLSGGSRQQLNLTLALMHDPDVLLLDEPYQGFDWETYLRFWELAGALRDAGRSVLVVSHLAYDAGRLDQLWRLHDGRLTRQDSRPGEVA